MHKLKKDRETIVKHREQAMILQNIEKLENRK